MPSGARIAYQVLGDGPTIVLPAWFYTHLELLWQNPQLQAFFGALAQHFAVVLYDKPGCGLSDRDAPAYTLEGQVQALTAVIDQPQCPRLALFGFSQGGPAAVAYAAQHPEQVARLLLYSTCARTLPLADPATEPIIWEAAKTLIRAQWALGSSVLIQLSVPNADPRLVAWEARHMREAVDPEVAIFMLEQFRTFDVRPLLHQVEAPTLVLHRRGDQAMPFEGGRELAVGITHARFVPLAGSWHALYEHDEQDILPQILAHLDDRECPDAAPAELLPRERAVDAQIGPRDTAFPNELTPREVEVLRLIAAGRTSRDIAATLVIAQGTVERHVTNLYSKIGARGRAEATAYAFQHHLVGALST